MLQEVEEDIVVEANLRSNLYKVGLLSFKVLPFIIGLCYIVNSILSYFYMDNYFISWFAGIGFLPWISLVTLSFMLKFCLYHRLPLYYIFIEDKIITYDYLFGISISDIGMLLIHNILAGITILLIVYTYAKCNKRYIR